jgi:hypothetical protein
MVWIFVQPVFFTANRLGPVFSYEMLLKKYLTALGLYIITPTLLHVLMVSSTER